MVIHWPLLLLGILLLWFPRRWMRFGTVIKPRRRRRNTSPGWKSDPWNRQEPGDPRINVRIEFTKPRNFIDFFRAGVGTLVVLGAYDLLPGLTVAAGAGALAARQLLVIKLLILLVAVLIQTVRVEERRLSFFAPVFFLTGLSIGLCGPWAALFALLLVWSVSPMFANAQAFLVAYALLLGGFGVMFRSVSLTYVGTAAGLCFLPVLLSLLTKRRLGVFTRKPVHMHGAS